MWRNGNYHFHGDMMCRDNPDCAEKLPEVFHLYHRKDGHQVISSRLKIASFIQDIKRLLAMALRHPTAEIR
jgi:hypothetical protein